MKKMTRRILGVLAAMWLVSTGLSLCLVQGLPRTRLGLSGTLAGPLDHPVTLTARVPDWYGLTRLERRAGLPALNTVQLEQVALGEPTFRIELPAVSYCTRKWLWAEWPPPPAVLELRFSDAPDEIYVVWRARKHAGYYVLDPHGGEKPTDAAAWRIDVQDFSEMPRGVDKQPRLWVLSVTLERRREADRSADEPARMALLAPTSIAREAPPTRRYRSPQLAHTSATRRSAAT